jgi:hypothetical protein
MSFGRIAAIPTDSFPVISVFGLFLTTVSCIREFWIATTFGLADSCSILDVVGAHLARVYFKPRLFLGFQSDYVSLVALFETAVVACRSESISKSIIVFVAEVTARSWTLATKIPVIIVTESIHFHTEILIHLALDGWWNTLLSRGRNIWHRNNIRNRIWNISGKFRRSGNGWCYNDYRYFDSSLFALASVIDSAIVHQRRIRISSDTSRYINVGNETLVAIETILTIGIDITISKTQS